MTKELSSCCNASVTVQGKTTHYYVCDKCGKACDLANNQSPIMKTFQITEQSIGMLRQWLNEDRITDEKKLVTNENIMAFLIQNNIPLNKED